YAVGAADLCAAGIGAPHIRQRLYWGAVRLADTDDRGSQERRAENHGANVCGHSDDLRSATSECGETGGLADTAGEIAGRGQQRLRPEHRGGDGAERVEELTETDWQRVVFAD